MHRGFPVIKILRDGGLHIVIDRMEWKDEAIIITVTSLPRVISNPDLWNFITAVSNNMQELKNGIQTLMRSTVAGLPQNIEGLACTANARFEFIEAWRRRLLPENYPKEIK